MRRHRQILKRQNATEKNSKSSSRTGWKILPSTMVDQCMVHQEISRSFPDIFKIGARHFWRFVGHPNIGKILLIVLAPDKQVLILVFTKHQGVIVRIALDPQNDMFLSTRIGSNRFQVNIIVILVWTYDTYHKPVKCQGPYLNLWRTSCIGCRPCLLHRSKSWSQCWFATT